MHHITKLAGAGAAVIALALVVATLSARSAYADDLPYKAFGIGLKAGAKVEALKGTTSVGMTTVDAAGNWILEIPATKAANGDKITFTVDGVMANETITFQSGFFPAPPGLKLTLAAGATATATATTPPATATGTGTFSAPPVFSADGIAQVVFNEGTAEQLVDETIATGAKSVWVQDPLGVFVVFIPGAPAFVNANFYNTFIAGFANATSVTLVK